MNSAMGYTEGSEIIDFYKVPNKPLSDYESATFKIAYMSKNLKGASKYIQKEIDEQKNIVIIETLKESSAKEKRERAEKQIEKLQAQLEGLSPGTLEEKAQRTVLPFPT